MKTSIIVTALLLAAAPAHAQLGGALGKLNKAADQAQKVKDLRVSEADERKIGETVSLRLRKEFGVYQNAAVTKYVTLVGTALARASARPDLQWEFIVLDTEGVNAMAAPGGIVHITRGALGMIKSEAELAGVLGHEVAHVAKKHTVHSIEKNRSIKMASNAAAGSMEWVNTLADATYDNILEKGFDRGDENDADQEGVRLASKVGYSPGGLATFLTKLAERNSDNSERDGLFASHPETRERIDRVGKQIVSEKLVTTAMVTPRYAATITFTAKSRAMIAAVGSAGGRAITGDKEEKKEPEKKAEPKRKGLGLGLDNLSKGKQAESTQASASAGGRALGRADRKAAGGANPNRLPVTVTPAELAAFTKGIA